MGAVLIPVLLSAASSAISSVFAPAPPAPTIIKPAPVQPDLSQGQASQIAKTAEDKGKAFGNQMLSNILDRARKQGLDDKTIGAITDQYHNWFNTNQNEINQTMGILAAHSQDVANYTNQVNQNNFQTQYDAVQASMPKGQGLMGGLVGGLAKGLMGGFGGGMATPQIMDPTVYSPPPVNISGPDTFDTGIV